MKQLARRVHHLSQPAQSFPRADALAGCGAVGKACKLAFSYGAETDPIVAATFLSKLTRSTMHTHVPPPLPAHESAFVPIPLKAVRDVITGMPKKSAPHRDGWTWKLFGDMAEHPQLPY